MHPLEDVVNKEFDARGLTLPGVMVQAATGRDSNFVVAGPRLLSPSGVPQAVRIREDDSLEPRKIPFRYTCNEAGHRFRSVQRRDPASVGLKNFR